MESNLIVWGCFLLSLMFSIMDFAEGKYLYNVVPTYKLSIRSFIILIATWVLSIILVTIKLSLIKEFIALIFLAPLINIFIYLGVITIVLDSDKSIDKNDTYFVGSSTYLILGNYLLLLLGMFIYNIGDYLTRTLNSF